MKLQIKKLDPHEKRVYLLGYRQGQLDKERGLTLHLISRKDFLTHNILRVYEAGYIDGYLKESMIEEEFLTHAA